MTTTTKKYFPLVLVAASAIVTTLIYLQTLSYPFISDDIPYLVWNTRLAELQLSGLWQLLVEPYNDVHEFLPLRDLSYWLDMKLFGLTSSAFRLNNIFLYLSSLPLVYLITREVWRYFRPSGENQAPWAAAAVTALFALHPALIESVIWISGRKYILPNFFAFLTLWLAFKTRDAQGLSKGYAVSTLLAFIALMFSKSSYVTVAVLIAVLWLYFLRDVPPKKRNNMLSWPFAMILLASILTWNFIRLNHGFDSLPMYFGIEAITRTMATLGWMIRLAVSPENRHFYYPVFEYSNLYIMTVLGLVAFVAGLIGLAAMLRHRSLEGFALFAFLIVCLPYIQIIPNGAPSMVSDRYLALAIWPVILLVVALAWRLNKSTRIALLLAFALAWGSQYLLRPRDWQDFEALIEADAQGFPGYYMPAFYKVTMFQLPRGQFREATETAESISTPYIRGMVLDIIRIHHGADPDALSTGKLEKAIRLLWKLGQNNKPLPIQARWNSPVNNLWQRLPFFLALEWKYLTDHYPHNVLLAYNAGMWNLNVKRYIDAIPYLQKATGSRLLPATLRGTAYYGLGLALLRIGDIADAKASLGKALDQAVSEPRAKGLLDKIYRQSGQLKWQDPQG